MKFGKKYIYKIEVQFEDCDMQNIAHHPNLLCYLERARIKALEEENILYNDMLNDNIGFVISDIAIKFIRPTKFKDTIYVITEVIASYKHSIKIYQTINTTKPNINKNLIEQENPIIHAALRISIIDIKTLIPIDEKHIIFNKLNYVNCKDSKNYFKKVL